MTLFLCLKVVFFEDISQERASVASSEPRWAKLRERCSGRKVAASLDQGLKVDSKEN